MVTFTIGQLEKPPTVYGMLRGSFGVRVFYNQPAGLRAVEQVREYLAAGEEERLKKRIQSTKKLPERGETPELEELVAQALPPKYVM